MIFRVVKLLGIFSVFIFTSSIVVLDALCSTQESKNEGYPYRLFGTKTLYDVVKGQLPDRLLRAPPSCEPVHISITLRHGSRYPGKSNMEGLEQILQLAKRINTTGAAELCKMDLEAIRSWKIWYNPILKKNLAPTGYKEMRGIAGRYARTFPELFKNAEENLTLYRFVASESTRNEQSARAFMDEMFTSSSSRPQVEIQDQLLRFYDYCKRFIVEVDTNDTVLAEVDRFVQGPYMREVVENIARRLGLPSQEMNYDLAKDIYKKGCIVEQWVKGRNGPWCLLFTKEDLLKFEYEKDMEIYLTKMYGHEINHRQSCILKKFILQSLKDATNGGQENGTRGTFTFSHARTIASLMAGMGFIQNDGPYLADEYMDRFNRSFRSSLLTPGSGHIAFVLYHCQENPSAKFKVQIIINEHVMTGMLNDGNDDDLWELEHFLHHYDFYNTESCDFEQMCRMHEQDNNE